MSDINNNKQSLSTKLVVIGGSAILSAVGSAIAGFFVDIIFFGWYESAVFGLFVGFPVGLLIGGGIAMYLLGKGKPTWNVVGMTLLVALIVSSFIVAVLSSLQI